MRYLILSACVVLQLCLGGLYAWSSLVPALRDSCGLTSTQTQLIFGIMIAVFTVTMVPAGRLLKRTGPRPLAMLSAILFAIGYVIASLSGGSFPILLLGAGVVAGIATGFGYVCPLATAPRWFPKHMGLVTGIAVAGFGAGAIVLSSLAEYFLSRGMDVLVFMRWVGLAYGSAILLSASILKFAPHTVAPRSVPSPSFRSFGREHFFWGLVVGMFCGTFGGLLVIGNLKPLTLAMGIPPWEASLAVSLFAVGNAAGRIVWGWLADRLRALTVWLSLAFLAVSLALLGFVFNGPLGVLIASLLVGFGFGACFSVYAAQVLSRYGLEGTGSVYPLIFLAYGAAGVAGPFVGGWLYDSTLSYDAGMIVGIALVVAGLLVTTRLLRRTTVPARDPRSSERKQTNCGVECVFEEGEVMGR